MSNVEFQEEKSLPQMAENRSSGMYRLIIGIGLAKDEKGAQVVLVGLASTAFAFAIIAPFMIGTNAKHTQPTEQQIQAAFKATTK